MEVNENKILMGYLRNMLVLNDAKSNFAYK